MGNSILDSLIAKSVRVYLQDGYDLDLAIELVADDMGMRYTHHIRAEYLEWLRAVPRDSMGFPICDD